MSEPDRPVILGFSADEVDCIVSALRLAASCSALMNKTGEQQINLHLADAVLRASLNAGAPTGPMCFACDPPHRIDPKPIILKQAAQLVAMMEDRDLQHKRLVEAEAKLAEATDRARMLKADLVFARDHIEQYANKCLRDEIERLKASRVIPIWRWHCETHGIGTAGFDSEGDARYDASRHGGKSSCDPVVSEVEERGGRRDSENTERHLAKALEALRRVQDRAQSIRDIAKNGME